MVDGIHEKAKTQHFSYVYWSDGIYPETIETILGELGRE